jgi:hypothetical protein
VGHLSPISSSSTLLDRQDATFVIKAGLARSSCYALEAVNFAGYYLRHRSGTIVLERNDASTGFRADATFCARRGFAGGSTVSFEAYSRPGTFLRHSYFRLYTHPYMATDSTGPDASFIVSTPLG